MPPNECTLEPVPKPETPSTYIYAVAENSPPRTTRHKKPWASSESPKALGNDTSPPLKKSSRFLHWSSLVLYAVCIAALAGTGGGFLGEQVRNKGRPISCDPGSSLSAIFSRTIYEPRTACAFSHRLSFNMSSQNLGTPYTIYCAIEWSNDDLLAMSAPLPDDCIEACVAYNTRKGSQDRACVGGEFVPSWWNQTKAMAENDNMPYNCFLKGNDTGTKKSNGTMEVVSLCLEGNCKSLPAEK